MLKQEHSRVLLQKHLFLYLRPEVIKSQGTPVIIAVQNSLLFSVSWKVFKMLFQGIAFD